PEPMLGWVAMLVVGILQGLALWWVQGASDNIEWPPGSPAVHVALLIVAVAIPPASYCLRDWLRRPVAWGVLVVMAFALAGFGLFFGWLTRGDESVIKFPFPLFLAFAVLLFHVLPFVQVFLDTGRWSAPYERRFFFAWRNGLHLVLAAGLTGI